MTDDLIKKYQARLQKRYPSVRAKRDPNGSRPAHLLWMLKRMPSMAAEKQKPCLWFVQGALLSMELLTADELRQEHQA